DADEATHTEAAAYRSDGVVAYHRGGIASMSNQSTDGVTIVCERTAAAAGHGALGGAVRYLVVKLHAACQDACIIGSNDRSVRQMNVSDDCIPGSADQPHVRLVRAVDGEATDDVPVA